MNHIALILDGNRRFAKNLKMPSKFGHYKGVEKAEEVIDWAIEQEVSVLSYFLFSKDNWKRTDEEVSDIFSILKNFSRNRAEAIANKGAKVNVFGDINVLSADLREVLEELVVKTANNNKITLNLCINYSGKWDIINATQTIISNGIKEVTEEIFASFLQTKELPEPDILIRTGGDMRISNLFLWQMAYTELFFVKSFFPEFSKDEFINCITEYKSRNRRFGGGS